MSGTATRLGELVTEVDERDPPDSAIVFSVSEKHGIIPQSELFDKQIAVADRSNYRRVQCGDVVFNPYLLWNRAVGVCFDERGGCVSPAYVVLRPRRVGLARALHYLFRSSRVTSAVDAIASGSVTRRRTAPLSDILDLAFRIPGMDELEAASHQIGTIDEKIELNRRMSETLEAMARAIFKSWFVDFDPVRAKAEGRQPQGIPAHVADLFPSTFQDSPLGPIPKEWRPETLGTFCTQRGGEVQTGPFGSQLHASDYVPAGVPVVMPQDIVGNRVAVAGIARVPELMAASLARHRMRPGDVVFSRRGDVGRCALVSPREEGWLCGTGCLRVRPGGTPADSLYTFGWLTLPESRAWIERHAVGATMPNLNTSILSAVPMLSPSSAVLAAFWQQCGSATDLQNALAAESATLAETRDTLLPILLQGTHLPLEV